MHPGLVEEEMSAFKLPYTALKTSFPWNMSPWLVLLEVVLLVVLSIDAIEMEAETFPLFVWLATTVLLLPIVQILSPSFFGFAAWRELLALFPLKPLDAKWVCVVLLMISNLSGLALVVISIIKGGKDALLLGFCGGLVGIYALMFLRFALEVGIGVGFSCCCGLHWKWELGRRGPVVPHPETIGSFDGNHYADFLNVWLLGLVLQMLFLVISQQRTEDAFSPEQELQRVADNSDLRLPIGQDRLRFSWKSYLQGGAAELWRAMTCDNFLLACLVLVLVLCVQNCQLREESEIQHRISEDVASRLRAENGALQAEKQALEREREALEAAGDQLRTEVGLVEEEQNRIHGALNSAIASIAAASGKRKRKRKDAATGRGRATATASEEPTAIPARGALAAAEDRSIGGAGNGGAGGEGAALLAAPAPRTLTADFQSLMQHVGAIEEELNRFRDALGALQAEKGAAEKRFFVSQQRMKKEHNRLSMEKEDLRAERQLLIRDVHRFFVSQQRMKKEHNRLSMEKEDLRAERQLLIRDGQRLEDEKTQCNHESRQLREERQALTRIWAARTKRLRAEKGSLHAEKQALERQNEALQAAGDQLRTEAGLVEEEHNRIHGALNSAIASIATISTSGATTGRANATASEEPTVVPAGGALAGAEDRNGGGAGDGGSGGGGAALVAASARGTLAADIQFLVQRVGLIKEERNRFCDALGQLQTEKGAVEKRFFVSRQRTNKEHLQLIQKHNQLSMEKEDLCAKWRLHTDRMQAEKQLLIRDGQRLEDEKTQCNHENRYLREEKQVLTRIWTASFGERACLRLEKGQLQAAQQALENSLSSSRQAFQQLKTEKVNLVARTDELQLLLRQSQAKNDELEKKNESLETAVEATRWSGDSLERLQQLRDEHLELQEENESLQEKNESLLRKTRALDRLRTEAKAQKEELLCITCTESKREYLAVPCGHVLCCADCRDDAAANDRLRHCWLCRAPMTGVQQLYYS